MRTPAAVTARPVAGGNNSGGGVTVDQHEDDRKATAADVVRNRAVITGLQ